MMNDDMTALLARATALLEAASALAADIKALVERTGPQIDLSGSDNEPHVGMYL